MSFEYLIDPDKGPQWKSVLPGSPEAFFLKKGEGEHALLFGDLERTVARNPARGMAAE